MKIKQNEFIFINYNGTNFGDNLLKTYFYFKIKRKLKLSENIIYSKKSKTIYKINTKMINIFNKYRIIKSFFKLIKSKQIYFIGGIFQDISSKRSFVFYFMILLLSILIKKEIYILASSFEINSFFFQNKLLYLLEFGIKKNLIKAFEVRDVKSYNFLKKLKIKKEDKENSAIKLVKDPLDSRKTRLIKNRVFYLNDFDCISDSYVLKTIKLNQLSQNILQEKFIFISLNKSYINKEHLLKLIKFFNFFLLNNFNLIFLISDNLDIKILDKILNKVKMEFHIIKLDSNNLNPIIKLIKSTDIKILYSERLHPFLVLGKHFDYIIIDEGKVKNYFETWYQKCN